MTAALVALLVSASMLCCTFSAYLIIGALDEAVRLWSRR